MSRIPEETIQQIKQSVDIVDVINQYVHLTKRGSNYTCSCPFHEDNNPSFSVSQTKQIFKCFSCGRGGTVFRFLQEIEGISFVEAVQKTAEFGDVPIQIDTYQKPVEPSHQAALDIHRKTQEFYHYYLTKTVNGEQALNYLLNRDMNIQTIDQFQLGLAPLNSDVLHQFLQKEGFNDIQLLESGIFYQTDDKKMVDRFRGRIIIPLRNTKGEPIAFSGRIFDDKSPQQNAKYLNSPQTAIFDKSKLLFNLDLAKPKMQQTKEVLVCEGYMDVIALSQAGFNNAVATMGTSLTEQHLNQLSRMNNSIYFIFDGDAAGQKATMRAFELSSGFKQAEYKAIIIPQNMDPDDWIKERGTDSFQRLINQALSSYDYQKEYYKSTYNLDNEHQLAKYIEQLVQLVLTIDSPIEQQLRIIDISDEFNIDETILKEQVARLKQQDYNVEPTYYDEPIYDQEVVSPEPVTTQTVWQITSQPAFQSEKYFLFMLIYQEGAWNYLATLKTPVLLINDISCEAYAALQNYYYDEGHQIPLTGISHSIENEQLQYFFNQLLWEYELFEFDEQAMVDTLRAIEKEFIQIEIKKLTEELSKAQMSQEYGRLNEIIIEISRLNHQIKH